MFVQTFEIFNGPSRLTNHLPWESWLQLSTTSQGSIATQPADPNRGRLSCNQTVFSSLYALKNWKKHRQKSRNISWIIMKFLNLMIEALILQSLPRSNVSNGMVSSRPSHFQPLIQDVRIPSATKQNVKTWRTNTGCDPSSISPVLLFLLIIWIL